MGVRREWLLGLILLLVGSVRGHGSQHKDDMSGPPSVSTGPCRVELIEGEVTAGKSFDRAIGNGLRIELEAIASGWILRILPVQGEPGNHDYAELANPPYRSVSPLLMGTDYSFRAQDALAWNPRRFHFAPDRASYQEILSVYQEDERLSRPGATDGESSREVESRLATLVSRTPEGELTILDAHLVPGTGDQSRAAAMVATHLNLSAHEVDQPANGNATALGRLNWLRFRIRLDLPKGFRAEPSLQMVRGGSGCK